MNRVILSLSLHPSVSPSPCLSVSLSLRLSVSLSLRLSVSVSSVPSVAIHPAAASYSPFFSFSMNGLFNPLSACCLVS
jgi:hypothetical protein